MVDSLVSRLTLYPCRLCSHQQQQQHQQLHFQTLPFQLRLSDFQKGFNCSQSIHVLRCNCMCFQTLSTWAPTHEILEEPKQNVDSPSSASVIAAAMNAVGHSNINFLQRLDKQPRGVCSGPSKDFLELCQQQLAICDSLFGRKAKLTVYIRPVESYGTPDLELRRVAAHPKWTMGDSNETLVLVGNYGAAGVLRSTESALLAKEVMELPDFNALVLPMVKDLFLVGVLVAEGNVTDVEPVSKGNKLRSGEPEWTTQDDGLDSQEHEGDLRTGTEVDCTPLLSNDSSSFTSEQKFEGRKIAQSLAIACVMDQVQLDKLQC